MLGEVLLRKPRRYKPPIYAIYYHVLSKSHLYQKQKKWHDENVHGVRLSEIDRKWNTVGP